MKNVDIVANKIFETLNLGTVTDVKHFETGQNEVYTVTTSNKKYYLKEYSKDAIKTDKDLLNRKRQLAAMEKMSENGVPLILPISFDTKYFIKYGRTYFLIFDYREESPIADKELTSKKVKKLSNTLAIIHKLNIKATLPCQYKKINIDFNKYIKKLSKKDETLSKLLEENKVLLEELVKECNQSIKLVKEHLCISHNDYKLKNIIWHKDYMYLIDFDAVAMSNPTVSLAEAAYALSRQDSKLNEAFYKDFLNTYLKKYGTLETDFESALKVCMNGKLKWFNYLLNKALKKDQHGIDGSISMIRELVLFINSKEIMLDIYTKLVTTKKIKFKRKGAK